MIASRERQHGERIPKIGKLKLGVLPVAAVYSGNASGKTNLFKGLHYAKRLIVKGTQPYSLFSKKGVSSLLSFSEYKDIRYDKDIRKSYLEGRLGGILRILLQSPLEGSDYCQKSHVLFKDL